MPNVIVKPSAIIETLARLQPRCFPALQTIIRPTVPTDAAAYYLNRQPQTLRAWACLENGPIRPVRINGRLAWRVSELQALLNGGV